MKQSKISASDLRTSTLAILKDVSKGDHEYTVFLSAHDSPVKLSRGSAIVVPEQGDEKARTGTLDYFAEQIGLRQVHSNMVSRRCTKCGKFVLWNPDDKHPAIHNRCA